ncbi:MAG: putative Ig domain-containing protein [Dokdonella sp.]
MNDKNAECSIADAYGAPFTPRKRTRVHSAAAQVLAIGMLLLASLPVDAQVPVPEILHYTFDETGTSVTNHASAPPAGTAIATIMGTTLTQNNVFTPVATALNGTGVVAATDYVNTGWATDLPASWTISFFTSGVPSSSTLFYIMGDTSAGSFRCFTNGVAGPGNWILRGTGITDVLVSGAATLEPHMVTFVYDQPNNVINAYKDGMPAIQVPQAGAPSINGAGPFKVAGYGSNVGLSGAMADFRVYSHALTAAEVSDIYTFITTDTPLTATTTVTDTTCIGGNDGTATVTPSGGLGPFTYAWAPSGGTAATATGLSAGAYTATVTDNFGLTTQANATVAEPTAIVFGAAPLADAPVHSPYLAIVAATGGTGTLAYVISSGALPSGMTLAADGTLSGTPTVIGNYAFTVSAVDANTCSAMNTYTLAVVVNPDLIFLDGFEDLTQ